MRSEHQLLATLFAMGIRHQVVYPFYNRAAEAWGLHRVSVHYTTLDLLACGPEAKNSLHKFSHSPHLCPHTKGRMTPDICKAGHRQHGGWSADRSKALLDRVLHFPAPG